MSKWVPVRRMHPLIMFILAIAFLSFSKKGMAEVKVSEFGKYQRYSEAIHDGNNRISDYLTLSDGRRLAYDLTLPTLKGVPVSEPLPVLFKLSHDPNLLSPVWAILT